MSKYVKDLITLNLRDRLKGVDDALLVDMIGLDANVNNRLRAEFRDKKIHVVVVKNSLARRATEGMPLAVVFDGLTGTSAVCWGCEDIVSLAKEVTRLAKDESMAPFRARGGVMDGEALSAQQVQEISKWPSREEQLGLLMGQILGPGAALASQLIGPGGALASQIAQEGEEDGEQGGDG